MIGAFRYTLVYILPVGVAFSFSQEGWFALFPLFFSFIFIPVIELLFKPNPSNFNADRLEELQNKKIYDYLIYLIVPIQFVMVYLFLESISQELSTVAIIGRVTSLGLCCGILGINVAHELGHRSKKSEQNMARALLMTSLYMHFFIEHNRGHHKNVGTPEDSVTARKGEWLVAFWFRSIIGVYKSAWKISNTEARKKKAKLWSIANEMTLYTVIQLLWLLFIFLIYGWQVTAYYLLAAAMGYLLLETVEYIEHYGLKRRKESEFRYETTKPKHSWNSDHIFGRLLLFELSRHSDHHFKAYKKYQTLDHHDDSPQMPTGYPGMMLLSLASPLWFAVMNPKVEEWENKE